MFDAPGAVVLVDELLVDDVPAGPVPVGPSDGEVVVVDA